jgi:F1F0 ATPase subunit 2
MTAAWVVAALFTGFALGLLYFGGLWLTVRRMATAQSPALLFIVSFVVRAAVVVAGFYLIMDGRWERAAGCMGGLLLARTLVCRRVRRDGRTANQPAASLSERAAS